MTKSASLNVYVPQSGLILVCFCIARIIYIKSPLNVTGDRLYHGQFRKRASGLVLRLYRFALQPGAAEMCTKMDREAMKKMLPVAHNLIKREIP